jgi:hypothetical protein
VTGQRIAARAAARAAACAAAAVLAVTRGTAAPPADETVDVSAVLGRGASQS